MAVFIGTYRYNLDDKGRVVIPAKFRDLLGENFVLCKDLYNVIGTHRIPAICAFPNEKFETLVEKVDSMPKLPDEENLISTEFAASADYYEPDKQGRILLPQYLREYGQLEKEVVVVGHFDHMMIYSASNWDQRNKGQEGTDPYQSESLRKSFETAQL